MWGPPCGWDSSFNESHHKTEIKAPAKNTQSRGSTLVKQTISRLMEYRTVQLATDVWSLGDETGRKAQLGMKSMEGEHGAKFILFTDTDGSPTMSWKSVRDKDRVHHPQDIIAFCCEHVIPITTSSFLQGFTEHRRCDYFNNTTHIFRAHPSYQSTSGQANGVWYDWAIFELEEKMIPCQIMCFLNINNLRQTEEIHQVRGYEVDQNGLYAVVRRFKDAPKTLDGNDSFFIQHGEVETGFYLLHCNSIYSDVCVVPDFGIQDKDPPKDDYQINSNSKQFFVVGNQFSWLSSFKAVFKYVRTLRREDLLRSSKDHYLKYCREKESIN